MYDQRTVYTLPEPAYLEGQYAMPSHFVLHNKTKNYLDSFLCSRSFQNFRTLVATNDAVVLQRFLFRKTDNANVAV